jgi:agmatinase
MRSEKFAYANSSFNEATFVLVGVPDELGSHSARKGTAQGPAAFRRVAAERCVFERVGKTTLAQPSSGILTQKIFDYGDVSKKDLSQALMKLKKKIPIIIGGDHSITATALHHFPNIAVLYFDSHPDIICSTHGYYGSVLCDVDVDLKHSVAIGIREPEIEELRNIKKQHLLVISPLAIEEKGLLWAWQQIKRCTQGKKIYISIDLDVFDPAFAPGVSTPVPGGLHLNQVLVLMKHIMKELPIIGIDVMELTPAFDIDDRTAHLAVKLVMEMVGYYQHS